MQPQHAYLAAISRAIAFEDLDGGRLARAVGPQQRENLAARDGEAQVADSLLLAIRLREPRDCDGRITRAGSRRRSLGMSISSIHAVCFPKISESNADACARLGHDPIRRGAHSWV